MKGIKRECYRLVQKIVLEQHPICQFPGCRLPSSAGHHVFKRDRMGTAFDPECLIALCVDHHAWMHDEIDIGKALAESLLKDRYRDKEALSRMSVRLRQADFELIAAKLRRILKGG